MSLSHVRKALQQANQLFLKQPSAAKEPSASAAAVWWQGLRCEIVGPEGERAVTGMPVAMGGDGTVPSPGWLLRASMASCTATAIAMRAAMLGIDLRLLEVSVHSEWDARGLVDIAGVSTALTNLRMSIKIGADNVPDDELRELVEWGEAHSPVTCTLRERPPVAIEVLVA